MILRVGCWLVAVVMVAWAYGPALAAQANPAKDKQPAAQAQTEPMTTREQVARKLGKMTQAEQKAAAKSARQQGMLPGVAGSTAGAGTQAPPSQKTLRGTPTP
jgi:hypothetical protein